MAIKTIDTIWEQLPSIPDSGINIVLYHDNEPKPIIILTRAGNIFRYSTRDSKWDKYGSFQCLASSLSFDIKAAINSVRNQIIFIYGFDTNASLATLQLNGKPDLKVTNMNMQQLRLKINFM